MFSRIRTLFQPSNAPPTQNSGQTSPNHPSTTTTNRLSLSQTTASPSLSAQQNASSDDEDFFTQPTFVENLESYDVASSQFLSDPQQQNRANVFRDKSIEVSHLKKGVTSEYYLKIAVVGAPGVGKTSFIQTYLQTMLVTTTHSSNSNRRKFSQQRWGASKQPYTPTIGMELHSCKVSIPLLVQPSAMANSATSSTLDLKTILKKLDMPLRLQIYDIPHLEISQLASSFFESLHGMIILFDITDPKSLEAVDQWRQKIAHPMSTKILLCAHASDKSPFGDKYYVVKPSKLDQYVRDVGYIGWHLTSCKQETSILEAMDYLVERMVKYLFYKKMNGQSIEQICQQSKLQQQQQQQQQQNSNRNSSKRIIIHPSKQQQQTNAFSFSQSYSSSSFANSFNGITVNPNNTLESSLSSNNSDPVMVPSSNMVSTSPSLKQQAPQLFSATSSQTSELNNLQEIQAGNGGDLFLDLNDLSMMSDWESNNNNNNTGLKFMREEVEMDPFGLQNSFSPTEESHAVIHTQKCKIVYQFLEEVFVFYYQLMQRWEEYSQFVETIQSKSKFDNLEEWKEKRREMVQFCREEIVLKKKFFLKKLQHILGFYKKDIKVFKVSIKSAQTESSMKRLFVHLKRYFYLEEMKQWQSLLHHFKTELLFKFYSKSTGFSTVLYYNNSDAMYQAYTLFKEESLLMRSKGSNNSTITPSTVGTAGIDWKKWEEEEEIILEQIQRMIQKENPYSKLEQVSQEYQFTTVSESLSISLHVQDNSLDMFPNLQKLNQQVNEFQLEQYTLPKKFFFE